MPYKWMRLFANPASKVPSVYYGSENRVARLASLAGILTQLGYRRRPTADQGLQFTGRE